MKIGDEAAKSGVSVTEVRELAEKICALPHLELAGLMCIPPFLEKCRKSAAVFPEITRAVENVGRAAWQEVAGVVHGNVS